VNDAVVAQHHQGSGDLLAELAQQVEAQTTELRQAQQVVQVAREQLKYQTAGKLVNLKTCNCIQRTCEKAEGSGGRTSCDPGA
jgi:hypothetical protein